MASQCSRTNEIVGILMNIQQLENDYNAEEILNGTVTCLDQPGLALTQCR